MVQKYRRTQADQVYALLRERIVRLEMEPGLRFIERNIAEQTGFGAMPIREALDRLSQEGLIRTIPRHGYQVTPVDAKYARDFVDIWSPIAVALHRLALINASEEQHQEIVRTIERFGEIQRDPDRSIGEIIDALNALLSLFAKVADNEHLTAVWRRLSGVSMRVFHLASLRDGRLRERLGYDLALAAWRSRKPAILVSVVEHLVEHAREGLMGALETPAPDA